MATNPNRKTDIDQLHVGSIIAIVTFGVVQDLNRFQPSLEVSDLDTKNDFQVTGKPLIENILSADSFVRTEEVSRTKLAQTLISSINKPFTVEFVKADGSVRRLVGRLIKPEPLLGRSMVEDLEKPSTENRIGQVDHRTITLLIVDNVRYVLKK